jgi:DNA-binding NtrC family response regulator
VILMTAHGTPQITKGALDLGAYEVMHKAFELHELEPILLKAPPQVARSGSDWHRVMNALDGRAEQSRARAEARYTY